MRNIVSYFWSNEWKYNNRMIQISLSVNIPVDCVMSKQIKTSWISLFYFLWKIYLSEVNVRWFFSKGSKLVIKIVLSYFPTSNSIYSVWSFGFNRSFFRKNGLIVRNKYLFSLHFGTFFVSKKFSLVVKNREVVKIGTETNTTTETFLLLCSFFFVIIEHHVPCMVM